MLIFVDLELSIFNNQTLPDRVVRVNYPTGQRGRPNGQYHPTMTGGLEFSVKNVLKL